MSSFVLKIHDIRKTNRENVMLFILLRSCNLNRFRVRNTSGRLCGYVLRFYHRMAIILARILQGVDGVLILPIYLENGADI